MDIDVGIRKDARHVVQGRETDAASGTDEQGVILGMGVRADNQPVVSNRVEESAHVFGGVAGVGSQEFDNIVDTRSAFILIPACRGNGKRLADIFLMDAPQTGGRADSIVAFDARARRGPFPVRQG